MPGWRHRSRRAAAAAAAAEEVVAEPVEDDMAVELGMPWRAVVSDVGEAAVVGGGTGMADNLAGAARLELVVFDRDGEVVVVAVAAAAADAAVAVVLRWRMDGRWDVT